MALDDVRKAFLAQEWRQAVNEDASVQTTHLLAPEIIEDSLLTVEANASSEASRRQTLRGTKRDPFELRVAFNDDTETIDLGDVVKLTHTRYGLTAGKQFVVTDLEIDGRVLILNVWG